MLKNDNLVTFVAVGSCYNLHCSYNCSFSSLALETPSRNTKQTPAKQIPFHLNVFNSRIKDIDLDRDEQQSEMIGVTEAEGKPVLSWVRIFEEIFRLIF